MRSVTSVVALAVFIGIARADDWCDLRGPNGDGHAHAKGVPLEWSESNNVAWKTPIDGLGWSTPTIRNGKLWLTTAVEGGKSLRIVCLSVADGKVLHDVEVFRNPAPARIHAKNSHASPSAYLANGRVYVHFGTYGTACLNENAEVLWKTQDLKYAHGHGPGGSAILVDKTLFVNCDGTDVQYVAALDAETGKIRWKTERPGRMAYSTPLLITVDGKPQIASVGGQRFAGYDLETGAEIWKVRHTGYSCVCRPVWGHGMLFVSSGYDNASLFAIRPNGNGDITDSNVVWTLNRSAPHNPSPILIDDCLYIVADKGVASCLEAKTGKITWQKRLPGEYSASPIFADGKLFFLNESGITTVIKPGSEFEAVATNRIEGRTLASFAAVGDSLFLRSDKAVYRLRSQGAAPVGKPL